MAVARPGSPARLLAAGLAASALIAPAAAQESDLRRTDDFFLGGKSRLGGPLVVPRPRSGRTNRERAVHHPPASERPGQEHLRAAAGDRVFFSEGSAEIGSRAAAVLAAQAVWLAANPHARVLIEGHADEPLSPEEVRALAARRAQAASRRLLAEGVAPERISITSYGADRRVAVCAEPECAAQNRRALTRVLTERSGSASAPSGVANERRRPRQVPLPR